MTPTDFRKSSKTRDWCTAADVINLKQLRRDQNNSIVSKCICQPEHTYPPFNGPFSRTTQVSQYQKGKTNLDFTEAEIASDSGISWAICKFAPRSRQITCQHPTTQFFTDRMPFLPPNQQCQSTEGNLNSNKDIWQLTVNQLRLLDKHSKIKNMHWID